ncbi:MAG TPA: hypothetical protein VF343_08485, partial [Syntrophales bacterium]
MVRSGLSAAPGKAAEKGEGYGDHTLNEPIASADERVLPKWYVAILPLLFVLILNYIMSRVITWDPALLERFTDMKLPLFAPSV